MQHRHLQLNIQQTMAPEAIQADVAKAFSLEPDTIVFNEACEVTHAEIRKWSRKLGYEFLIPDGAAQQVCLVWRAAKYRAGYSKVHLAAKGRAKVSPNRYVVRVRLHDLETNAKVMLIGTHMVSSGWTGGHGLDAWRKAKWHAHELVMAAVLRWTYRRNDFIVWSGDLNRPPSTFRGEPLPKFRIAGAATSTVLKTNHTHGGLTFDYVGVLSKHLAIEAKHVSTPSFHSDHDGVLADLRW